MRERPGRGWGWQPDKRRHPAAATRPRAPAQAAFLPRVPPSSVGMQLEHPCGPSTKIPRRWDTLRPSAPRPPCPHLWSPKLLPLCHPAQPRLSCIPCPSLPVSPACPWCMWDAREPRVGLSPALGVSLQNCACPSPTRLPVGLGSLQPPAQTLQPCTDPPALHRPSSPAQTPQAHVGTPQPWHLLALPGLDGDRRHHSTQGWAPLPSAIPAGKFWSSSKDDARIPDPAPS